MGLSQWRNFLIILAIAAHICVLCYAASVSVGFKSKGKCYGDVQIQDKNMETFDDDRWHFNNSKVLCRNTGCGTALESLESLKSLKSETTPTSKTPDFWCTGNENSFDECQRKNNKTQNSTANKALVVCSDAISKPRISLTLPNGTSINLSHAEILRGSSFSIECTVDSIPGKLKFYFLQQYNGNSTKLESNHSASFNISKADYKNEGNYSCRYTVNLNGTYESDETGWIHVTVTDSWWKLLLYILLAGVPVLLLIVLLVACLVRRRRKLAEKPSDVVLNQVTVRNSYIDDDQERDYVNVEPVNTSSLGTEEVDEKDSDSHDYEDPSQDKNDSSDDEHDYVDTSKGPVAARNGTKEQNEEEDSSDDGEDYVNPRLGPVAATGDGTKGQSEEEDSTDDGEDYVNLQEQIVDIYGEDLDIYQNL
ncbi:uncharacterized protein LOC103473345 isoform X2 [Poecilia reticulata]|uniref:uncharacterized protein LOC103473345 isoform X2 n=1 Tax=Poecilia reticulata TaxID=8081 RepID=UPI0004A2BCF0|nr:PREDICTED: uncharacterized protein LOC103473345 isoform X2 [Poecilia reticulata]